MKGTQGTVGADKGFLGSIAGFFGIAKKSEGNADCLRLIGIDQLCKAINISIKYRLNCIAVTRSHRVAG